MNSFLSPSKLILYPNMNKGIPDQNKEILDQNKGILDHRPGALIKSSLMVCALTEITKGKQSAELIFTTMMLHETVRLGANIPTSQDVGYFQIPDLHHQFLLPNRETKTGISIGSN